MSHRKQRGLRPKERKAYMARAKRSGQSLEVKYNRQKGRYPKRPGRLKRWMAKRGPRKANGQAPATA